MFQNFGIPVRHEKREMGFEVTPFNEGRRRGGESYGCTITGSPPFKFSLTDSTPLLVTTLTSFDKFAKFLPNFDLLTGMNSELEVLWSLKDQDDGTTQAEPTHLLSGFQRRRGEAAE